MLACGAVPTHWTRAGPQSRGHGAHADDRDLGAITELRAFAHPTRRAVEGHGHTDAGLELARGNHSLGRRRERNRADGAAAPGAELDLEQREMQALQERLARRYSTLAVDWPGFGEGARPQLDWTPDAYAPSWLFF